MFVSVDGKAREVKEIFAGGADGLAHKVNEMFGSVDGVAKLVYSSAPEEHNAFNSIPWAEIKQIAEEGELLGFFNKGDKVNIKLTQPLIGTDNYGNEWFYQDTLTLVIAELTATGMRLVSHTATPGRYTIALSNDTYVADVKDSTDYRKTLEKGAWGMCSGLYNRIKEIDNALPEDFRDVLTNFAPLYKYEYYVDGEGKTRLRKEYDDCRVRQISKCGYEYHNEFVEERNRYEYILDFSPTATNESVFKKYIPVEKRSGYDKAYGVTKIMYQKNTNVFTYTCAFADPYIGWKWDWENYDNWNQLNLINSGEYSTTRPETSVIIPEMVIGEI